jgi:alkylation response protein AidB-like acyl-CoA dehydrogenase
LPVAELGIWPGAGVTVAAPALADARGAATLWGHACGLALLAACAHAIGQMQALVEATGRHVGTRRQFGQALAGFQAVQHRLVDMHVAVEEARALLHATARRLAAGPDAVAVSALGLVTARAGRLVAQGAVQLHGAFALTAESGIGARVIALEAALVRHGTALGHATVLGRNLQPAAAGAEPAP